MRAVLWGLIVSFVGFAGWVLFSLLFAIAKLTGAETAAGVFFITTFGVLCFFGLPVGAALDFATRRAKLRYFAYALIIVAVICWAGAISAGIMEEEAYKPAVFRGVNIVKEGPYADGSLSSRSSWLPFKIRPLWFSVLGLKRKLAAFLHLFGLSCLGGAVFLELLVLSDIIRRGYFLGVEPNLAVALFEVETR